jgi:hypothetical protein
MKTANNGTRIRRGFSQSNSARHTRLGLGGAFFIAALAIAASFVMSPPLVGAIGGNPSLTVVISQVYGGAGCGTAGCSTYQNDFIELFNRGNTPVSINGWSVQYAAATGTAWQVTSLPNVTLQPGQYFLVSESFGANGVNPLPTPDAAGTIAMSATAGKVALVNCTTALTGACPSNVTGTCSIIDFVGYGATANCSETSTAPAPSTTTADVRGGGGAAETDNNSADFSASAPTPRNTASPFGTPTDAKLISFDATRYEDGQVLLKWRTGFEVENLGFNIYREDGGKQTRINPQMIAGSALLVGAQTNLMSGRGYEWSDSVAGEKDVRYWIESVDLNGQSAWRGPFAIDRTLPREALPPRRGRAPLLSGLGIGGAKANFTDPVARVADAARPATAARATAAIFAAQSDSAARPAIKLSVTREGWYRITQPELVAAGLDPDTDPRGLRLLAEGQEQPLSVSGEADGRFDSSDSIEFYGLGLDTPSTDARAYWLVAGAQAGSRVKPAKGNGSRAAAASFPYTVERKDKTVYFSSLRNGEDENFFGAVIAGGPVDQAIFLRHVDLASREDATLEVTLRGVTAPAHQVRVQMNGTDLGEISFVSQAEGSAKYSLPHAALKEGENKVTLMRRGGDSDVSLVHSIRLTYRHTYAADDNALRFTATSKQRVTIDGFGGPTIRVMDVTDPDDAREVRGQVERRAGGYAVTLSVPKGGQRTLLAFGDDQVKRPERVSLAGPSGLRDKALRADLVIITRRDFFASLEPLKQLRESQGLSVLAADIDEIYDEFNYGEKSPKALKDFLAYARASWSKVPRFVLLVGDASFDPRGYLGNEDGDIVPTKLIDTVLMETSSDDWFADFKGDMLAEMAIGRLPARTSREAAAMVEKIIGYDPARTDGVLLISDSNDDGIDFEGETSRLTGLIPSRLSIGVVTRGRMSDAAAKGMVIDGIKRGQKIINYFGHGSVDVWRGDLLTSADAKEVANGGGLSILLSITCLNGYFQDAAIDSLAESLIKVERGGAAAVWASSGMCGADEQALMNQAMFRLMFGEGANNEASTLGEAALKAKAFIADGDTRRTYILFGDPAMRFR